MTENNKFVRPKPTLIAGGIGGRGNRGVSSALCQSSSEATERLVGGIRPAVAHLRQPGCPRSPIITSSPSASPACSPIPASRSSPAAARASWKRPTGRLRRQVAVGWPQHPVAPTSNGPTLPGHSQTFRHFFARKYMFVRFASAYVVMPGGFGTPGWLMEALTLIRPAKSRKIP